MPPALRRAAIAALGISVAVLASVGLARAETIGFDDVTTLGFASFTDYRGFSWSVFQVTDPVLSGTVPSGYQNGITSGKYVALNTGGNQAGFTAVAFPKFTLVGGNFTSAWRDNLQLTIEGYNGGLAPVFWTTQTLSPTSILSLTLNWTGLTTVVFTTSGGTVHPGLYPGGTHAQFALDDLQVIPTPVPATLPLFASALGYLGVFGWRRRKSAAST